MILMSSDADADCVERACIGERPAKSGLPASAYKMAAMAAMAASDRSTDVLRALRLGTVTFFKTISLHPPSFHAPSLHLRASWGSYRATKLATKLKGSRTQLKPRAAILRARATLIDYVDKCSRKRRFSGSLRLSPFHSFGYFYVPEVKEREPFENGEKRWRERTGPARVLKAREEALRSSKPLFTICLTRQQRHRRNTQKRERERKGEREREKEKKKSLKRHKNTSRTSVLSLGILPLPLRCTVPVDTGKHHLISVTTRGCHMAAASLGTALACPTAPRQSDLCNLTQPGPSPQCSPTRVCLSYAAEAPLPERALAKRALG